MSGVSIQIEGLDELKQAMEQATEQMRSEVQRAVQETTIAVHKAAVERIQRGPASGVVYEKYMPRRSHQASAPGEPPMSDTGNLASQVKFQFGELEGVVFTPVKYGLYLEIGTSNMEARPWLFPSLEENRQQYHDRLRGILR